MKTLYINYTTLKEYFLASNFKENVPTEVYYTEDPQGWDLEFVKGSYYIHCRVLKNDLFEELLPNHPVEDEEGKINAFKVIFLRKAIKVDKIGEQSENKVETPEDELEIPVTTPTLVIDEVPENKPEVDYV